MAHALSSNTWEAEADGSQIQHQPLHSKTASINQPISKNTIHIFEN